MNHTENILSVDPGNEASGILILVNGKIYLAGDVPNDELMDKWIIPYSKTYPDLLVLYEDMMPYSLQSNTQMIDTCKFIGQLEYRLKDAGINCRKVYRWQVKKFVYDNYKEIVLPRVDKKIASLKKLKEKSHPNSKRRWINSFIYVDDWIVTAAMKAHWGIATPIIGQPAMYGLSKHSWQALGVVSFYLSTVTPCPHLEN